MQDISRGDREFRGCVGCVLLYRDHHVVFLCDSGRGEHRCCKSGCVLHVCHSRCGKSRLRVGVKTKIDVKKSEYTIKREDIMLMLKSLVRYTDQANQDRADFMTAMTSALRDKCHH